MVLGACSNQFSHPDTGDIELEVKVDAFYKELFSGADTSLSAKVARLSDAYGDYFETYCLRELRIGRPTDERFMSELTRFMTMAENAEVIATCDSVYSTLAGLEDELTDAFKCFRYYFPDVAVPEVYLHFSGFNNKMFVDSAYLSLSIEHYLGADCRYYPLLEIPQYARDSKTPQNIAPDILKAWLYANFPDMSEKDDVLSAMIYQGKILFAQKKCMPALTDEMLFGFTTDELAWCKACEGQMWSTLAEEKLLYSTNPLDRLKLVNETPFTTFFGQSSPGRAALYCAFNIVCEYAMHNPDVSLPEMLQHPDAQQVLVGAHYRP